MTWLLTQMWALLGAAALLALILGWGMRGSLLRGRLRRSEVEAGLARTELEQARTEIEGLYAAQRRLGAVATVDNREEVEERDRRIDALNAEITSLHSRLEAATAELQAREQGGNEAAYAAVVGAAGAATGAFAQGQLSGAGGEAGDEAASRIEALEAEATELRGQIASLHGELETARAAGADQPEPVAAMPAPDGLDTVEMDKLRWQNDYLRTRLKVFEQKAGVQLSGEPPEGPEDVAEEAAVTPTVAPVVTAADDRETPDEELARLRWRNRYLEGRLAYLEEERSREVDLGVADAAAAVAPMATSTIEAAVETVNEAALDMGSAVEGAATGGVHTALDMLIAEGPATPDETLAYDPVETEIVDNPWADAATAETDEPTVPAVADTQPAPEAPPEPVAAPEPTMVDAAPQAGPVAVRPHAIDEPADPSGRDDLTRIEGIGPRIQDVLNSVGIYSFQQIAAWTPENEMWIDDYLSFSGRVRQQGWVEQAAGLISTNTGEV